MGKKETNLQRRLQRLVIKRGGYIPGKNHGNMITVKGISDLTITYKGLSLYWEVKTPDTARNVSKAQGIHCRLAKKAGAITAVISTIEQAELILDLVDKYCETRLQFHEWYREYMVLNDNGQGWDDGTSY